MTNPALTKKDIEDILGDSQHLLENWLKFKKYLMKSFTQEPLSEDEEGDFLEVKSIISRYQRMVGEKVKDTFYYGPEKIQTLTRQCISVGHLRSLPLPDRRNLLVEWHSVYVIITRLAGAFNFMKEGYIPKAKAKAGTSIASVKAGASGADKDKKGMNFGAFMKYAVFAAIFIGAIVFLLKKMGKI